MRKQLGTKNSKSNEGKQERIMVELRDEKRVQRSLTETSQEQITVGRTRRKDGG